MIRKYPGILLVLPLALSAQGTAAQVPPPSDTLHVKTLTTGPWGPGKEAVEEKRILNGMGGSPLGEPSSPTILTNGNLVVFDAKAATGPSVLLFDSNGQFIRTIGRDGSGPGEYGAYPVLTAAKDGGLLVWDPRNARINRYDAAGKYLSAIPFRGPPRGGDVLRSGAGGSVYVQVSLKPGTINTNADLAFVHLTPNGEVLDTVPPLHSWLKEVHNTAGIHPGEFVGVLSDGSSIALGGDKVAFIRRQTNQRPSYIMAERVVERARFQAEERKAIDATNAPAITTLKAAGTQDFSGFVVPEFKPAATGLRVDGDGRIWIRRGVESVKIPGPAPLLTNGSPNLRALWRHPWVLNAFRADGGYLGEVRLPLTTKSYDARGDVLWAVVEDGDGIPAIIRYRISGAARRP